MNFNDFIIDQEDYEFFNSLPKDEKLLFIYDLICEEAFGQGSTQVEIEPAESLNKELDLEPFKDHLSKIVEKSINPTAKVNVLLVNNKVILNSNSEKDLLDAINDMFMDGCIMTEYKMAPSIFNIFKQQLHCKAFVLAGRVQPITGN